MRLWLVMITVAGILGWAQAGTKDAPVRVPVGADGPKILKHVDPEYPPSLQKEGVPGLVFLDCVIGEGGQVESIDPLAATAGFAEAAIAAVRQWTYEPPILDERPVRLAKVVVVSFFLLEGVSREQLLAGTLGHANPLVREASARALGHSGKAAVDPLTKALADESPRVRATAAIGLGQIGRAAKKAIPSLKRAALDVDVTVRDAAARALDAVESK